MLSTITKPSQPPPIPSAPPTVPPPTETKRYDPASTHSIEPAPFGNPLSSLLDVAKTDDAQRIQQRLSELGTYSGDANGIWSRQAQQALIDFQLANGLPPKRVLTKDAQKRLFASTAVQVSATNVTTYAGEWALDPSQCGQDNVSDRSVTSITSRRARRLLGRLATLIQSSARARLGISAQNALVITTLGTLISDFCARATN